MEIAFILLAILVFISVVAIRLNQSDVNVPFAGKSQLFTAAERQFLNLIEYAVNDEFRVLCRVKLSDLVSLKKEIKGASSKQAMLKAGAKQIDFVLCDKSDLTPVMAIDLVYGIGKQGHNTQRDFFVNSALEIASIPHVRIKAKPGYTVEEVKECIEAKLVPLRRKQGKQPYSAKPIKTSVITPSKRPTRPLNSSRNIPKRHAAA